MDKVAINNEQRLYVLHCGKGFSCLGFDVCKNRSGRLAKELEEPIKDCPVGSVEAFQEYERLVEVVRERNQKTGFRSQTGLVSQLIGYEGWRVNVVNCWGEKKSFIVGKSSGCIPCHIELKTKKSRGGDDLSIDAPFKSFIPIEKVKSA